MVEYCSQDAMGNITVHVIEGNTPVAVKRAEYALTYNRILGYGTVHDVADWTMRSGNSGRRYANYRRSCRIWAIWRRTKWTASTVRQRWRP